MSGPVRSTKELEKAVIDTALQWYRAIPGAQLDALSRLLRKRAAALEARRLTQLQPPRTTPKKTV